MNHFASPASPDEPTVARRKQVEALAGYGFAEADIATAVIAAIFWLKARARWTESNVHELSGKDGQPIRIEISAADAGL